MKFTEKYFPPQQFRIPTLLGLTIILIGIISGVILALKEQIFVSKASQNISLQNITVSNITESEATISYQTSQSIPSFVTFGQTNPNKPWDYFPAENETTVLDNIDSTGNMGPQARSMHYVTIRNLLPKTTYQYKIIASKYVSDIQKFTTATPLSAQTGFKPVIGSVLNLDQPLGEGVIFLSIIDAFPQSTQIKFSGNFLIPVNQIRKADLSDTYPLTEDTIAKLQVLSDKGTASALFKLKISNSLPPLSLGQNVDWTNLNMTLEPASPSAQDIKTFDLNNDGKINAADNAIVLQNYSPLKKANKNPKDKGADLNSDGVVDQKDLDLMAKQINQ